jgi:hypothetical protein
VSMPASQDNFAYVLPGGQIILTAVFQTFAWSGVEQPVSGVQITITPMSGGGAVVGPTSDGIAEVDQATYTYTWQPPVSTVPGDYRVVWTAATPSGIAPVQMVVTVVAIPSASPSPGVYASVAQYQNESGDLLTPTQRLTVLLRKASQVIDLALVGAVYPTDADDMPTNPAHIDLFMRATCAQAEWMLADNDLTGVKSQYSTISFGGMSSTRTAHAQGRALPPLAPEAAAILQIGGALGTAPLSGW